MSVEEMKFLFLSVYILIAVFVHKYNPKRESSRPTKHTQEEKKTWYILHEHEEKRAKDTQNKKGIIVIEKKIYIVFERHMFKEGSSPGIEYVERNDTIQEETIQVVIK
jgi:hypothetical protein